jgi:hypothetical protein
MPTTKTVPVANISTILRRRSSDSDSTDIANSAIGRKNRFVLIATPTRQPASRTARSTPSAGFGTR